MQIDAAGIAFIKGWESCSLTIYLDAAGKSTIGWGHLLGDSEMFSGSITQEEAEALLLSDLQTPQDAVNRLADPSCNQNQFNALVSFAFNLGSGSLQTMLAHGWSEVPAQMPRWGYAGARKVEGLGNRRNAEAALFQSLISLPTSYPAP